MLIRRRRCVLSYYFRSLDDCHCVVMKTVRLFPASVNNALPAHGVKFIHSDPQGCSSMCGKTHLARAVARCQSIVLNVKE